MHARTALAPPRRSALRANLTLAAALALGACGGGDGSPADTVDVAPAPLGAACLRARDCASGVCLTSEYGPPFCTAPCESAWEACPAPDDAPATLCISFRTLPHAELGPFIGELDQFCVPRCGNALDCTAENANWEACDIPRYLGDPLYSALGAVRVCQAPSYQGKEPVDPERCDWEKTVAARYANEANLCRAYCDYLDRCKALTVDGATACCAWGCFNRLVVDDGVDVAWRDTLKCHIETSAAYPDTGPINTCTAPAEQCGGAPVDPTPPAARQP